MVALQKRKEHYECTDYYCDDCSGDDEEDATSENLAGTFEIAIGNTDLDWRKVILITGEAGTGKAEVFNATIHHCLQQDMNILFAVPTGLLAGTFRNRFGNQITCDTIHSAFSYPVKSDERPTINRNLSNHDLILLDEISMVPERIARHVIATISEITIRPVIVMAGDNQQQQSIETIDKHIVHVHSVLQKRLLYTRLSSRTNKAVSNSR